MQTKKITELKVYMKKQINSSKCETVMLRWMKEAKTKRFKEKTKKQFNQCNEKYKRKKVNQEKLIKQDRKSFCGFHRDLNSFYFLFRLKSIYWFALNNNNNWAFH